MTLREFFCFLGLHSRLVGVKVDKNNIQRQVQVCQFCGQELH